MSLLKTIFPGLENVISNYDLPSWGDESAPWNILSPTNENSIINQIKSLDIKYNFDYAKFKNSNFDTSEGPIHIHPTSKIGDYVRIEGPCFIGKDAEIRHAAYLRKGSWISNNAIVGHCSEIKNSILLPGAKAPHFNYVGDSILGFGINIGAGVKLSNVRNDGRNILVYLKDGTKINSGLKKFGALIGDKTEIGCNVVSNPGTILEPMARINPNQTLSGWNPKFEY